MRISKYKVIQIWKYTNVHVVNIDVKNLKEYVKEVNVYIQNYKVTSNRNICKETNKRNNEKIYKNNKYIQMFIYKKSIKNVKRLKHVHKKYVIFSIFLFVIKNHQAGIRRPEDVSESPLKVLMSRTYREPSRESQETNTKIDDLIKKTFFTAIVLVLHTYSYFLQEEQIFKKF